MKMNLTRDDDYLKYMVITPTHLLEYYKKETVRNGMKCVETVGADPNGEPLMVGISCSVDTGNGIQFVFEVKEDGGVLFDHAEASSYLRDFVDLVVSSMLIKLDLSKYDLQRKALQQRFRKFIYSAMFVDPLALIEESFPEDFEDLDDLFDTCARFMRLLLRKRTKTGALDYALKIINNEVFNSRGETFDEVMQNVFLG